VRSVEQVLRARFPLSFPRELSADYLAGACAGIMFALHADTLDPGEDAALVGAVRCGRGLAGIWTFASRGQS
jgi:hypothetical protein